MPKSPDAAISKLTEAVTQLHGGVSDLVRATEEGGVFTRLLAELQTLRSAVDDVRAEIEWAARNIVHNNPSPPPPAATRVLLDPSDPKLVEKVTAFMKADLPADTKESDSSPTPTESTASSPSSEESPAEGPVYCCENPVLLWVGDPESPGIYCKSCQFIVADYGQLLDERAERPQGFRSAPKERQQTLGFE